MRPPNCGMLRHHHLYILPNKIAVIDALFDESRVHHIFSLDLSAAGDHSASLILVLSWQKILELAQIERGQSL